MLRDLVWFFLLVIVVAFVWWVNMDRPVTYYTKDSVLDPTFRQQVRKIVAQAGFNKKFKIIEVDNPDDAIVQIFLAPRKDLDKWHQPPEYYPSGKQIRFSLTFQSHTSKPRIYIDSENWLYGASESGLTLEQYRQYVITHEFMHALGYDHQPCNAENSVNGTCGVMYQSTRGCPTGFKCGYQVTDLDYTKKLDTRYL